MKAVDSPKVAELRSKLASLKAEYDAVETQLIEAEEAGQSTRHFEKELDLINADMADMFAQIRAAREAGE